MKISWLLHIAPILVLFSCLGGDYQNQVLTRVFIGVDAPYMAKGRGSVLIFDSRHQPLEKAKYVEVERFLADNKVTTDEARFQSETPYIYICLEFNKGKGLTIASSRFLNNIEDDQRVNYLLNQILSIFSIEKTIIDRAARLAENAEIINHPITSR